MKHLLTFLLIFSAFLGYSKNNNQAHKTSKFGGCGTWTRLINKDGQVVGKWRQCNGYTQHISYK